MENNENNDNPVRENRQKQDISVPALFNTAIWILTKPSLFFTNMKKSGYEQPIAFLVIFIMLSFVIQTVYANLGLLPETQNELKQALTLSNIIFSTLLMVFFTFISAMLLHLIWKVLGNKEKYITSFRILAYTTAVTPVTTLLLIIDGLDRYIALIWTTYLIIVASIYTLNIKKEKAIITFTTFCIIFLFLSNNLEKNMEAFNKANEVEIIDSNETIENDEVIESTPQNIKDL